MSARYFHGGVPGLKVGDMILPPIETGYKCASDYGAEKVHRRDRVYLGTNLVMAYMFAALHPSKYGCAYEVEPVGAVESDPDYLSNDGGSVCCERAKVLRIHPLRQLQRRRVLKLMGISKGLL